MRQVGMFCGKMFIKRIDFTLREVEWKRLGTRIYGNG